MKINSQQGMIRSDLDSRLVFDDMTNRGSRAVPNFESSISLINFYRHSTSGVDSHLFILADNNDDNNLPNELLFRDIFSRVSKKSDKSLKNAKITEISKLEDSEEIGDACRKNRNVLSAVFLIWFFLAFALLLNAIYY